MGIEAEQAILAAATAEGKWTLEGDSVIAEPALVARTFNGWKKPADAALIVRAVNSYEAMLGLVEAAEAMLSRSHIDIGPGTADAYDRLRAALDAVTATLGGEG